MQYRMLRIVACLAVFSIWALPAFADAAAASPAFPSPVALVSRWAHILAAIVMLGGTVFMRFVLMPSVNEALGDEGHARLRPVIMKRWKWVVHGCIALFLASGLYNYIAVTAPKHPGDGLYHALFGVKFLLALGVFALASMLVSTREPANALRRNNKVWMLVTIGLAVATVLIGGVMKLR